MAGGLRIGSVFISGANRGIGLEFVKQFTQLPQPPKHIFATCRNPEAAQDLKQLADTNPSIHVHKLDVLDYGSFPAVAQWVEKELGPDAGLNVLINNAGHYAKEEAGNRLGGLTEDAMVCDFKTNAVSPLLLTQALLPYLKKAASSAGEGGFSCSRAAVVNITSRMGSIDDNTSGGSYSYRASKTALNMVTKSLSVDLKPDGILAVVLHPGWVKTPMGGAGALIDTTTSVKGLLQVMEGLNEEKTGGFFTFKGDLLPW